jgi:2,4-dienoyl-CoA reductase-like NADH-dependent reductase (Old Yellow Enzyme family)
MLAPPMPKTALFSPLTLRSVTFPNRIMVSPMGQCSAVDGCATDWHLMHLGSLAVSGAGAIGVEATAVTPNGRNTPYDLGLWNDDQVAALKPALAFCRRHSVGRIGLQLWHVGRKGSVLPAWDRHRPITPSEGGWEVHAPSAIPYPKRHVPVAVTPAQIATIVDEFAAAARRALALDLDYLEVHAAHGYLLHNFLSPLTNQRTDAYGGSTEKRMRIVLEVFEAVRAVWPQDKPVGIRISCTDWVDGGWSVDESVKLAKALKPLGCDYLTASSGGSVPEQAITVHPHYQVPFAERIRREAGIPTVAVGLITDPKEADAIIASGQADMVALARGMLFNPRWPWHAALALGEEPTFPVQYERAHPAMRLGDFLKAKRDG